ncbi:PLAT/LH2 domain-containing protein [Thermatribacter velox]|uniref:PLAT/LH2 domain-containing protein n=1 Tax=Thermatribacter velox TaxID=3039681 RepID=A0ABZ2YAT1_9BACT
MLICFSKLLSFWIFPFLFASILAFAPSPLYAQEGSGAFSHLFQVIYQWEPLQVSEGVPRIIASTSDRPQDVLQDGNLLAFVVRERTLVLVDLATQEVLHRQEFPEKCILHGLYRGYVIYYVGKDIKTNVLSVANWKESTFPGTLVLVTEGGFLVTRERETLHIFDLQSGELLFSHLVPSSTIVALGDLVLFPTMDESHNPRGYLGFSVPTRSTLPLKQLDDERPFFFPEYAGHTWENRWTFPGGILPVLFGDAEGVRLAFLDERGRLGKYFHLSGLGLPLRLSPSSLHFFDAFNGRVLLGIEDERGNFHLLVADGGDSLTPLGTFAPRGRTTLQAFFLEDGNIGVIEETGPEETTLQVLSASGERLQEKVLWPPGVSVTHCRIIERRELLSSSSDGHLVFRYNLPQGEITAVYTFPSGYDPGEGVFVYQGKGFTFLYNQFERESGIEKPALVAFDVSGESFPLPVELVEVSPHGESLYEVFEDIPTKLRFKTLAPLEELLTVSVEAVSITRGEERLSYTWLTPGLEGGTPKAIALVASLGPARKVFPMTVVPLPNPLELTVSRYQDDGDVLVLNWTLRNHSPVDIDDLRFDLETTNLQFSQGDAWPGRIARGEVLHGTFSLTRLFYGEEMQPQWNGYTIPASVTLRVTSRRGQAEALFEAPLPVKPQYAFEVRIQKDPERGWWYLSAEEIQEYLRVFDAAGNDITQSLRFEKTDTYTVRVQGLAPGFPASSLSLHLTWETPQRFFEFQPRLGSAKERVVAPPLKGSWDIPFTFPQASAAAILRPSTFTPPRFILPLPPNTPPNPDFVLVDDETTHFRVASFDGSPSRDPDGVIVNYTWSWPGGIPLEVREFARAFSAPQILPITLTVTDDRLRESSITREVAVDMERVIGGRRVTIPPAFVRQNTTTYRVEVFTGDLENAGTDARVFLALYEPREQEGVVYGSGVMELSGREPTMERGQIDVFQVTGREVKDLDHIALLHDNSGDRPGWFVGGLKVQDTRSQKEWVFVPNRWLALDEEDHKTYAEFTPVASPYPAGIILEGDRKSYNLIEVSDTVFILPENLDRFYFTCSDGAKTIEVYRQDGSLVGTQPSSGRKRKPPYIPEPEWGVGFDTANLVRPERFLVKIQQGQDVKERVVWVFPLKWAHYRKEALQAVALYPLKGKTDVFLCAQTIRKYLAELKPDPTNAALLAIDYGVSFFSIFGASPDGYLVDTLSECTGSYLENAEDILQRFGYTPALAHGTVEALTTLYDVYRWSLKLPGVMEEAVAQAYKVVLLNELGRNDRSLHQIDLLLQKGKELVEQIIDYLEGDNPASCQLALSNLKTLAVGNNPLSPNLSDHVISYQSLGVTDLEPGVPDYPLGVLLPLAMANVKYWREEGHPIYRSDRFLNILPHDPVTDTGYALDVYEPLLETIIQAGSILVNVCLLPEP